MINLIKDLTKRAKNKCAKIILPEASTDVRVMTACENILKRKLGDIVVFGEQSEFPKTLTENSHCQIVDIKKSKDIAKFARLYQKLRAERGYQVELAEAKTIVKDKMYYAMMMLKLSMADGVVAGASETTANVLRPALQIVRTKPDKQVVTGSMIMTKKGREPLLFGDVSLIENPDDSTLAQIALSNAEFAQNVLNFEPKIAMLAYSTFGSAKGELLNKILSATSIVQSESKFTCLGEMQADAALDEATGMNKGVPVEFSGKANILIFPDLNAGNIGYKLVERLGGYSAIGPIMLNFNKPVNDLSRGCTVDEIVNTYIITKLMA